MIQKALKYLVGLAKEKEIRLTEIHGRQYTNNALTLIEKSELTPPKPIVFNTLTGFADFIKDSEELETIKKDFSMVRVKSQELVALSGILQPDNFNIRYHYASAQLDIETFNFVQWHPLENFVISLQSLFEPSEAVNQILDWLGNLANEHVTENKDDGFTQSIQIRTGITTKSNVKIENPLILKPYRTFLEVDQPESNCILRLKDEHGLKCSLHEADGGMWKLEAIKNIAGWLDANLGSKVKVMA